MSCVTAHNDSFVAKLSHRVLTIWRLSDAQPPMAPGEWANVELVRVAAGCYEPRSYGHTAPGSGICWLTDSYFLIWPNILFDTTTCRPIGRLGHIDSPIFWAYANGYRLYTSHQNGEILAWDLNAMIEWCQKASQNQGK